MNLHPHFKVISATDFELLPICDVIKQNELELANTVFKIQPTSFVSYCLFNHLPNLCGVSPKLKPKQYPNRKCQKNKNHIFRLQTNFA